MKWRNNNEDAMMYEFPGNQKSWSSSQLGQFKASRVPYLHYRLFRRCLHSWVQAQCWLHVMKDGRGWVTCAFPVSVMYDQSNLLLHLKFTECLLPENNKLWWHWLSIRIWLTLEEDYHIVSCFSHAERFGEVDKENSEYLYHWWWVSESPEFFHTFLLPGNRLS